MFSSKDTKNLLNFSATTNILLCSIFFLSLPAQKGTVENTNKHLRKHLPKGTNLSSYTKKEIRGIEEKLNNRILKVLNYHTPTEAHTLFEK